jgi:transposase
VSDGDIPLFMRAKGVEMKQIKSVFGQILVELKKPINLDSILVCDSALYSQENLQLIKLLKWISRVPMTIKKAQEFGRTVEIEEIDAKEISRRADLGLEGYNWKESRVNYGGIEQIWLVVESKKEAKKGRN